MDRRFISNEHFIKPNSKSNDRCVTETDCANPKCRWVCKAPECVQTSKPRCDMPVCRVECEPYRPSLDDCKIQCPAPSCRTICKKLECGYSCYNECTKVPCKYICPEKVPKCKTTCEKPKCNLDYELPKNCPKPICNMICD